MIEEVKKEMPKPNLDEMIEKMKVDWEAEKKKMLENKEAIQKECNELSEKIKEKQAKK